ncbi:NADH-ubiquinone oxidoreductase chain 1 [Forsythia ovata]|uniref:NADH-ubiquinone oxidoreductase chain 1 n=1 Tax=Forsythia ovata TaxID=205694 RepID=A0ABD1P313_9LAMI
MERNFPTLRGDFGCLIRSSLCQKTELRQSPNYDKRLRRKTIHTGRIATLEKQAERQTQPNGKVLTHDPLKLNNKSLFRLDIIQDKTQRDRRLGKPQGQRASMLERDIPNCWPYLASLQTELGANNLPCSFLGELSNVASISQRAGGSDDAESKQRRQSYVGRMKRCNKTGGYPQWSHCTGRSEANKDGQLEESATCGTLDYISSNPPLERGLSSSSTSPLGGRKELAHKRSRRVLLFWSHRLLSGRLVFF